MRAAQETRSSEKKCIHAMLEAWPVLTIQTSRKEARTLCLQLCRALSLPVFHHVAESLVIVVSPYRILDGATPVVHFCRFLGAPPEFAKVLPRQVHGQI